MVVEFDRLGEEWEFIGALQVSCMVIVDLRCISIKTLNTVNHLVEEKVHRVRVEFEGQSFQEGDIVRTYLKEEIRWTQIHTGQPYLFVVEVEFMANYGVDVVIAEQEVCEFAQISSPL